MKKLPFSREMPLDQYFHEISRYPLLSKEEELRLARKKKEDGDLSAANRLVVSNLRFVLKIAYEYKGYALNITDLVQEGNIGLMKAVERFDPDRGTRLISYAVWWIRAYIQSFIIKSWSLVKVGTTQAQRRLFFKIRSERAQVYQNRSAHDSEEVTKDLALRLNVTEEQVRDMDNRLTNRDLSLDQPIGSETTYTYLDGLLFSQPTAEVSLINSERNQVVRKSIDRAMDDFNERERYIIVNRLMDNESPKTLQDIGNLFKISRERVRQIENGLKKKLRSTLEHDGICQMTT